MRNLGYKIPNPSRYAKLNMYCLTMTVFFSFFFVKIMYVLSCSRHATIIHFLQQYNEHI